MATKEAHTYEVKFTRVAARETPDIKGTVIAVFNEGERITGTTCEVDGLPWLQLSLETMRSHPSNAAFSNVTAAWVLIDATNTELGLGRLLTRAPAELGWCAAYEEKASAVWEVVAQGGVVVSKGKDTSSEKMAERLQMGALIKVLEQDGHRLRYSSLNGKGPQEGWVSTKSHGAFGKDYIVDANNQHLGKRDQAPTMLKAAEEDETPVRCQAEIEEALRLYCQRFELARESSQEPGSFNRQSFAWDEEEDTSSASAMKAEEELRAELEQELESKLNSDGLNSDREDLDLCAMCNLPLGERRFGMNDGMGCLHAECVAKYTLLKTNKAGEIKAKKNALILEKRHMEYEIGWKVEMIPRNVTSAAVLAGCPVPQGMCCLLFDEKSSRIRAVPTIDPSAAVNLEYLSIALKVRHREGREPEFSLDPVDANLTMNNAMQVKRFEPYWLKDTSVGDVLFQSDYHLKELSMGVYPQPVVGMKSCFDFEDVTSETPDQQWNAREWFVVRKAEVQVTEDNVLIPYCKMGVEAREQIVNEKGDLEDKKVTRLDHPMVKFAEAFTENFDLIAERKSVIYHLREVAKASIMAKYLLEVGADLEPFWFNLTNETRSTGPMVIPQLWNECAFNVLARNDAGQPIDVNQRVNCIYGGVRFGLEAQPLLRRRPELAAGVRATTGTIKYQPRLPGIKARAPKLPTVGVAAPAAGVTTRSVAARMPQAGARMPGVPAAGVATRTARFGPMAGFAPPSRFAPSRMGIVPTVGLTPPMASMAPPSLLRGVDLNLGQFDLASSTKVTREAAVLGSDLTACTPLAGAFWQNVDTEQASVFGDDDKKLLRDIFHPVLSDRREEGDRFSPPDTSFTYAEKLKALVQKEKQVQEQRKDHFFSTDFVLGQAGPLFPSSWNSSPLEVTAGCGPLHARPDYLAQTGLFDQTLKSATPFFEQSTEEGLAFRIYRIGSLEVRTTQEHGGREEVGAVFSRSQATPDLATGTQVTNGHERVAKITEYVEEGPRYYVVIETECGNVMVTEKLEDGVTTWVENPRDLEARNSFAKVLRCEETNGQGVLLRDVKSYQTSRIGLGSTDTSAQKRYARNAFNRAFEGVSMKDVLYMHHYDAADQARIAEAMFSN